MSTASAESATILKIEGPPGSGKTRALAREACRLVAQEGISAEQMLILSFSATGKYRLNRYVKTEANLAGLSDVAIPSLLLGEWFLNLLREFGNKQASNVQLLNDSDARVLLQEILRQVIPIGHPLYYVGQQSSAGRLFFELIQQLQLQGISAHQLAELAKANEAVDSRLPLVAAVYQLFEQQTQAVHLICHADLMSHVSQLLRSSDEMSAAIAARLRVILIDEAQELSEAHHQFLSALPCRLVMAGNEKLSIRSFRGAKPELYANLGAVYKDTPVTFEVKQACIRSNEAILSLLNAWLPHTIWEEQSPDLVQLQELVQFGFYSDPEREAEDIVGLIEGFIRHAQVNERPANWSDCAILLRSAHYKQHLMHALMQRRIPFRSEMLSEELVRFQHFFFDLLNILAGWQVLKLSPGLLQDSDALRKHLSDWSGSLLDQATVLQENSRHLYRWLDVALSAHNATDEMRALQLNNPPVADDLLCQLSDLRGALPAIHTVWKALLGFYTQYCQDTCPVSLFENASQLFYPGNVDSDGSENIGLDGFKANLIRLNEHYRSTFGKVLSLQEILSGFHSLWEGVESSELIGADHTGAVRLLSIHQVQGEEFPMVVIPFLVSDEFPHVRHISELLSDQDQAVIATSVMYRIEEAEEARLLAVGMSRATQKLVLSSHRLDAGAAVIPSGFYTALLNHKRRLLGQQTLPWVCQCETDPNLYECGADFCAAKPGSIAVSEESLDLDGHLIRYHGESRWALLEKEAPAPLFDAKETVYLSASSIKTYMKCPRQFYYQHLLRLTQPGSEAATLGSLIHRVMERFNLQARQLPYTVERLKAIAEALFSFQENPDAFFAAGFEDRDLVQLRMLTPLTLSSLRQRLLDSIDDLERKGYFERYRGLKQVHAEKALENIHLDGIERCRFTGTMDAVVQLADGSWEIIDYKTFRSAYSVGLDTCDKRFLETMEPLPDEEELSHSERFADKLSASYPKDYQLPLYYLACNQDPTYRGKLRAVALQVIRPEFPENPNQGAIRLEIPAAEIEAKKQQMIDDINRYIVEPIVESAIFSPNPSRSACSGCGYIGICDQNADLQEGAEA